MKTIEQPFKHRMGVGFTSQQDTACSRQTGRDVGNLIDSLFAFEPEFGAYQSFNMTNEDRLAYEACFYHSLSYFYNGAVQAHKKNPHQAMRVDE